MSLPETRSDLAAQKRQQIPQLSQQRLGLADHHLTKLIDFYIVRSSMNIMDNFKLALLRHPEVRLYFQ